MTSLDGRKRSSVAEEAAPERGRESANENDQETTGAIEVVTATGNGTGKDYATGTEEIEGDTEDKSSAMCTWMFALDSTCPSCVYKESTFLFMQSI